MAYGIGNFDGTKAGVSADYPFNDIKNAPNGTKINRKTHADILQTFHKIMNALSISTNGLPDNVTNGYQMLQGLQGMMGRYGGAIVESILGIGAYNTSSVYIISGAKEISQDGLAYYNGELYFVAGQPGPACGGGLVTVLSLQPNATVNKGMRVLQMSCGAPGSGLVDFTNVVYFNAWQSISAPSLTLSGGGSVSVTTWNYAKWILRGRTVTVQLRMSSVTISSSGGGTLDIPLSFLGTRTIVNNNGVYGCAIANDGAGPGLSTGQLVNGSPATLKLTYGTWVNGTYDINVDLTFEVQ